MKFYDTHMHSHLSFDCFEDPLQYLTPEIEVVAFTEHLDLNNMGNHGQDDIPDFSQLFAWKDRFKTEYGVQLLTGVEVGYVPNHLERLQQIVAEYDFDLILLSVHQNTEYDFMDSTVKETPENMINGYLDQLLQALDEFDNAQIMTHFDYGFRIHSLTQADIATYEGKLVEIFEKCIERGLAFELNTKSIVKYNKKFLYEWAIPKYQALGGEIFSLGSDAHKAEEHFSGFKESIELLESFDVTEVSQFSKKELSFFPISDIKKMLNKLK